MKVLDLTSRHLLLGILTTSLWQLASPQTLQNSVDLRAALTDATSYHKGIRPVAPQTNTVIVELYLAVMGMGGLDEKSQTMETVIKINAYWINDFFTWTEATYGGLQSMLIIQDDQWVPDIIAGNSAEQFTAFGHKNLNTYIMSCGKVQWTILVKIISNCDIDITYYPFDTQKCDVELVPEFSYPNEMRMYIHDTFRNGGSGNAKIDFSQLNKDGTWDIIGSALYDGYTFYYAKQTITLTLLLQRKTTYYILSLVLPVFFLSFTATLVFALPADAGEKMGTCITVLLSYAVYLTIVTEYLPDTSLNVSLLGLYLVILFGLCTVCVILTTFIIRINFKPDTDKIGKKTRAFTMFARKRGYSLNFIWLIRFQCETKKVKPNDNRTFNENGVPMPSPTDTKMETAHDSAPKTPEVEDDITWVDVAKALDWAAFLLTTFLNAFTTFLFFIILMIGSAVNVPTLDTEVVTNTTDFGQVSAAQYANCP